MNMVERIAARVMSESNKTADVRFETQVGKPAEADEAVGAAYRALVGFKMGMDSMDEIPSYLMPCYKQALKTIDELTKARQETNQLREMFKRLPQFRR